jgi:membrane protein YdbS with pleckstrin-like domain
MNYDILHLDSDEHVILEVRKHWIVFAGYAISLLIMAVLPLALMLFVSAFLPKILPTVSPAISSAQNLPALFLFFYSIWLLFLWVSFFVRWTKFHLDVWYITEKRIIDVRQNRFFDRDISNLSFDKIQDIDVDVHGLIATMFGFGTVEVQTASEDNGDFIMSTVENPDNVRRMIFDRHNNQ